MWKDIWKDEGHVEGHVEGQAFDCRLARNGTGRMTRVGGSRRGPGNDGGMWKERHSIAGSVIMRPGAC